MHSLAGAACVRVLGGPGSHGGVQRPSAYVCVLCVHVS